MWKSLAAVVTAAVVASAITGFPNFNIIEPVSATSTAGIKAIPAPGCPDRGWPYQQCTGQTIRLITTDKLN
jgi:hypothetical protein